MKNLLAITLLFLSTLTFAQKTSKEEVTPELVAQREIQKKEVVNNYLTLKNNLVLSDGAAVVANATELKRSLVNFRFKKLTLDEMNAAMKTRKELIALTTEVAATNNLNKQREIFKELSAKFWDLAPKFKAEDATLHLQICPMTSATWLSDSKEIKNPYYPKNMLTCGEVKASL